MKILLTAFDPFGGETTNASLEVLERIRPPRGSTLVKLELPTVFGLAGETLLAAIRKERPDVVLCLGQAAGRAAVTPESTAVNFRRASIPDNAGQQPADEPVIPGAPDAYLSALPIREMAAAAQAIGVPAAISDSAGTFVCNDLMFTLLHAIATQFPQLRGGFVHVPCCVPAAKDPFVPLLPPEKAAAAIEAMLAVILQENFSF